METTQNLWSSKVRLIDESEEKELGSFLKEETKAIMIVNVASA